MDCLSSEDLKEEKNCSLFFDTTLNPHPRQMSNPASGSAQAELGRGTLRSSTNCATSRSVAFSSEISKEQAVAEIG